MVRKELQETRPDCFMEKTYINDEGAEVQRKMTDDMRKDTYVEKGGQSYGGFICSESGGSEQVRLCSC